MQRKFRSEIRNNANRLANLTRAGNRHEILLALTEAEETLRHVTGRTSETPSRDLRLLPELKESIATLDQTIKTLRHMYPDRNPYKINNSKY